MALHLIRERCLVYILLKTEDVVLYLGDFKLKGIWCVSLTPRVSNRSTLDNSYQQFEFKRAFVNVLFVLTLLFHMDP